MTDTYQVQEKDKHIKIGSVKGEELDEVIELINDKLDQPLDVYLSGTKLYIESATKQKQESDRKGATQDSYKWKIPHLFGVQLDEIAESWIDVNDGNTDGDFILDPDPGREQDITAAHYVKMGVEIRQDTKFHIVWGTSDALEANASYPAFSKTRAIEVFVLTL